MHPRNLPLRRRVTNAPAHSKAASSGGTSPSACPSHTAPITARRASSNKSSFSRLSSENILGLIFGINENNWHSPSLLHTEIDLTPEHLEIVHGRENRANDNEPKQCSAKGLKSWVVRGQNDSRAGQDLQNHLRLTERRCRNDESLDRSDLP